MYKNKINQYLEIRPFFTDNTADFRYDLYLSILCEVFYDKDNLVFTPINRLTPEKKKSFARVFEPFKV